MSSLSRIKEVLKEYITSGHIIGTIVSMILVASLLIGIVLWIFSGGEIVVTPNVIGLDTLSALEKLTPHGLGLKIEGQVYNSRYKKGFIVSQNPEPNERVRNDRDMNVIISKGTENVSVPNLSGLTLRQAKVMLQQIGLYKGKESLINTPKFARNRVLAQYPPKGVMVKRGIKVNLLVSEGPEKILYMMPDCLGKNILKAEKNLNEAGLVVSEVKYEYNPEFPEGTIIWQNPVYSTPIKQGEKIKFKVTRKDIFKDKNKLTRYAILYYIPPIGLNFKRIRIVVEDPEDSTIEEIFNEQNFKPGEKIHLIVRVTGENIVKIYVDDELVEEKSF